MGASVGGMKFKGKRRKSLNSENIYLKTHFKLSDQQIEEYWTLFTDHSDNNKVITRFEFRNVYQMIYTSGDASDFADRVFDAFDTDKNGTVDFIEFAAGLTMMDSKMMEQQIAIAFHMYDEDGSNTLSKQEVINMMQVDILFVSTIYSHVVVNMIQVYYFSALYIVM